MNYKYYDHLPQDAKRIREEVFMREQGFENEFDETDENAKHIVMYRDDMPVAVCRIFKGEKDGEYILGRLAVIKEFRGLGLGSDMLGEAEKLAVRSGGTSISLHAQCRAESFYADCGYTAFGDIEYDEGCPHVWMGKKLV